MKTSAIRELYNKRPIEAKVIIMNALRKNEADMNKTASEIGVSKRTLYRLIKDSDLFGFWGEQVAEKAKKRLTAS